MKGRIGTQTGSNSRKHEAKGYYTRFGYNARRAEDLMRAHRRGISPLTQSQLEMLQFIVHRELFHVPKYARLINGIWLDKARAGELHGVRQVPQPSAIPPANPAANRRQGPSHKAPCVDRRETHDAHAAARYKRNKRWKKAAEKERATLTEKINWLVAIALKPLEVKFERKEIL